jgi:hypothetical protein
LGLTSSYELPLEEWLDVHGTDGFYEVSNFGRVRSWLNTRREWQDRPHLLNPSIGKNGYRVFCHRLFGGETRLLVHREVCRAFHGSPPATGDRIEVRHLDGNKLNNMATNLAWGTSADNAADRVRHGTSLSGERNPFARLTRVQVSEIRASFGYTAEELASMYGVSRQTITRILRGETWKGVVLNG